MIALGPLQLPTYFVVISALITGVVFWINQRSYKKQYSGSTAFDLFFAVMISGFLGARLFHVVFEEWNYYRQDPVQILMFWQGGFVFYGGLIFGVLGGWLALQWKKQSFPLWLDFFTPLVSLGYAGGRVACFLTGCCYGKICDLPWAYQFRHPTQLYAVVLELVILFFILRKENSQNLNNKPGHLFALWLLLHSASRIVMEIFRDDPRGPQWGSISVSLALSILFVAGSAFYLGREKLTSK